MTAKGDGIGPPPDTVRRWWFTGHQGATLADPQCLARFWALAVDYVLEQGFDEPDNASIVDPSGVGPAFGFLRVPEPKTSENRIHLAIRPTGKPPWDAAERERLILAKVDQLVGAGAGRIRAEHDDDGPEHVVMTDPEGNEFCVG